MTKWLIANTDNVKGGKIEHTIPEKPLLHACCNEDHFGEVNIDIRKEVNPDHVCDITKRLPFEDNSFAAAFADTPWINKWKWDFSKAMKELLRVAPIVYTINPWVYGGRICTPTMIQVSWRVGINAPILFIKYERNEPYKELLYKMEKASKKKNYEGVMATVPMVSKELDLTEPMPVGFDKF